MSTMVINKGSGHSGVPCHCGGACGCGGGGVPARQARVLAPWTPDGVDWNAMTPFERYTVGAFAMARVRGVAEPEIDNGQQFRGAESWHALSAELQDRLLTAWIAEARRHGAIRSAEWYAARRPPAAVQQAVPRWIVEPRFAACTSPWQVRDDQRQVLRQAVTTADRELREAERTGLMVVILRARQVLRRAKAALGEA